MWLDASDSNSITIASGVSQWSDKSGNARNATQSNTVKQPAVITNALNNKNVVRFDGTDDVLTYNGSFFANTSYSVYAVVTRRSGKDRNYFLSGNSTVGNTNLVVGWATTTFLYAQYFNDIATTVSSYASPDTSMWGMLLNTASGRLLFQNGAQVASSGTTSTLSSYNGANLGNFLGGSDFYQGDIAEIVATTSALSTSDRQKMEGYLAHKWGLTASLPSDHPYKSVQPTVQPI
jgi:hypothetical protein